MKINIPWKALNTVKRYVITTVPSLINSKPNDHVRPRRHRRANAPRTQDLEKKINLVTLLKRMHVAKSNINISVPAVDFY